MNIEQDYPLSLMHTKFRFKTKNGTILPTSYGIWRQMHNSGGIETYREEGIRMVKAESIDLLKREGKKYGKNDWVYLVEKA